VNFFWIPRLCILTLLVLPSAGAQQVAQTRPQTAETLRSGAVITGKYSTEPYVIEKYTTALRFEDDGTAERTITARIRIQNDAAAKQFSELSFAFDANAEELKVAFVRVRKSDGSVVDVDPHSITEEMSPAVRDAPAFANAKEKHIAVPMLQSGDTLEYETATRVTHPAAPGQFWTQHAFVKDAIALDERLEISVPRGHRVTVRSPGFLYATDETTDTTHTIYRWKHVNTAIPPESGEDASPSRARKIPQPDIQLTSFASWSEVSRWYATLARNSTGTTPELRAKAADLIEGHSTELDKAQAIYEYVARNIRYVDLPLGAAGFTPHTPSEVFNNQYGDAKDKNALLAAMLQVAGIQANAALIPQSQKLDVSAPSPSQLDHAITAAALGEGIVWMDSTPEVAPFRFLPPSLRHKPALLVSADGAGKIVETPADPPFPSTQQVDVESHVSDLGKLTAHVHYQMRGDNEFVLRLAFRRTPPAQWKDLGQTLLTLDGLHGEVTLAKSSDPLDTRGPFEVDLEYTQSNFLDWASSRSRVGLPLLSIGMPDAPRNAALPITLGSPLRVVTHLSLSFAPGYAVSAPVGIAITRDYAAFQSSYRWKDGTLTADRSLDFKMRELPASGRGDYLAFTHGVEADQTQPLIVANDSPSPRAVPPEAGANDLFEAGSAALAANNAPSAIPLFERAVVLDPSHPEAWNNLGLAHLRVAHFAEAVAAFEKQLQINPADAHAHNYLGLAFEQQQKYEEAAEAFRRQMEIDPLDPIAHSALGTILLAQHRYSEAAPELDKATVLTPDKAELQIGLGEAYINLGQNDKAAEAFERAVAISPTPAIWNNAAFHLADHKVNLATAQKYAESALSAAAADLSKVDLQHMTAAQIREFVSIGNYWDTLGWIYFQKGDLDAADRYIRAAWLLEQHGEIADHLAQIYEKRGNKEEAIRACAIGLAAAHPSPDTRARLTLLLGGNSQIDDLVSQAKPKLTRLRTLPAGKLLNENAQADFAVLLSPARAAPHTTQVESVRFLGGSEKLRAAGEHLRALNYGPIFPDASSIKLVRRGTLSCSAATGECSFILLTPDEMASSN